MRFDLFGDVNNIGTIGAASGSTLSVVGDLVQNGIANLVGDARLIVYRDFSGNGGTTGGTLEVLGSFSPGNSVAQVPIGGDLLLGAGSETLIELAGTLEGEFDQVFVAGDLTLGGELNLALLDAFLPSFGDKFTIFDLDGGLLSGRFSNAGEGDLVASFGAVDVFITYEGNGANDVVLWAVPEPTAIVFVLGLGFAGCCGRRRSRHGNRREL